MASLSPVVPGLYRLELGVVNAYLLEADGGLVLIDTGYPGSEDDILRAVDELGHTPDAVRAVVVTHHHTDHAGALAAVLDATGAAAWMHPLDAAAVREGVGMRAYRPASGVLNWVLERAVIRRTPPRFGPAPVAHEVRDGDEAPGGLRVLHTPGHSAGHIALLWEAGGVLVAGDACTNLPTLTLSIVYEDLDEGRRSLRRLADQSFDVAVFGHGGPIVGAAADRFRRAFGDD